jgi:hypothetical protein
MKTASRLLLFLLTSALVMASGSSGASVKTKTFTVNTGSPAKVATGIVLKRGETVKLAVSGDGKCGAGNDCPAGNPGGSGQTCAGRSLGPLDPGPAPQLPYGAVVGQVGNEAPFATGAARTVTGSGELILFYNDCAQYYGDNTGSFTVTVTYKGAENGLTVAFEPATAAPGTGVSTLTITDRDDKGEPVSGALIRIRPPQSYGNGEPSALVCDESNRLVYPTHIDATDVQGISFNRTTDSAGQIHLKVFAGAVGGKWTVDAVEKGETDSEPVFGDLSVGEGGNATQLPPELTSLLLAGADSSLGDFSNPVQRTALAWLGGVARSSGALAGVAFAPIYAVDAVGATNPGIVLYADSPGVRKAVLDYLSGASKFAPEDLQAVVIDIRSMSQLLLGSRIAGQKVNAVPYRLPSLEQWANGTDIQITDPTVQAESHATHIPIPARGRPVLGVAQPGANEDLLYGFGPYPPFGADPQTQAQFAHCLSYTFSTSVTPHSPVRLEATGSKGGVAGIDAKGKAVDTLPGAIVNYRGSKLESL